MNFRKSIAVFSMAALLMTGCSSTTTQTDSSSAAAEVQGTVSESAGQATYTGYTTEGIDLNLKGDYSEKAIAAEWSESDSTLISLSDSKVSITGTGAAEKDGIVTITSAGTYVVSGKISEGQIVVNLSTDENVQLVLNRVEITSTKSAPITALSVKNLYLTLADGTENVVNDNREPAAETTTETTNSTETTTEDSAETTENASEEEEIPTAAIYSKDDLIINGSGTLTVNGGYNDGITGKDDLEIIDGTFKITATDDGIVGKDSVSIRTGKFEIHAGGDGIKSSNTTDTTKGYVVIDGGTFDIYAGKSGDGIDSSNALVINQGTVNVLESEEGLECLNIVINDGTVNVTATDDGINISDGSGSSNEMEMHRGNRNDKFNQDGETPPSMPADDDTPPSMEAGENQTPPSMPAGQNETAPSAPAATEGTNSVTDADSSASVTDKRQHSNNGSGFGHGMGGGKGGGGMDQAIDGALVINGGTIMVNAGGDGLDSNGHILVTGGYTVVSGSTNGGNGALDYNGTCDVTGGVLIATGNSGMAQKPSDSSELKTADKTFDSNLEAGTKITMKDSSGKVLYTFTAEKSCNYITVTAPNITEDGTYTFETAAASSTEETI